MSYEILYTSAPSGLKPGSSGYCTVQGSRGIPAPAVDLLESLSGYRHVFTPGSPEATHNPVNWGHYLIRIAGRVEHVLSRVGDCELDYTGRSNKLAHHLVVDAPTTATLPGGPAWFLSRPGLMYDQWDGTVSHLGTPRIPPPERRTGGKCAAWGAATGDSGWGGVLAESFLADPERKVFVVYAPGTNVLALFEEAIALLPEHRRWDVTFATYGAALPKTVDCLWSGLVAGSPEVAQSHRFVNALRIDLTQRMSRAAGGPLVELARTGVSTARVSSAASRTTHSARVVSSPEPVYEGGYQPVPPPPAVLAASAPLEGPEPPSLPPRSKPKTGSTLAKYGLAILALLAIAGTAVGAVLWLRRSPPPLPAPENAPVASNSDQSSTLPDASTDSVQPAKTTDTTPPDNSPKDTSPSNSPAPASPPPSNTTTPPPQASAAPVEPSTIANAPMTPKTSGQPSPKAVKRVVLDRRTPLVGRKEPIHVLLPGGGQLAIDLASKGSLYVPRSQSQTDLYNLAGQTMKAGHLHLVARKGGFPTTIFDFDLSKVDVKSPKIEVFPKTVSGNQALMVQYGALLLHDSEKDTRVFVVFGPAAGEAGAVQFEDHSLHVRFPEEHKELLSEIAPSDLVIEQIELTHQEGEKSTALGPSDFHKWNLESISNGFIQSIELLKGVKVLPTRQLHLSYRFQPELGDLNTVSRSQRVALESKWAGIELQLPPPVTKAVSDLIKVPEKIPQDEATLNNAVADFKGMFPKLPEGDEDTARKRMKLVQEIDGYLESLAQYRHRVRSIGYVIRGLKATSGRVKYRVWPVPKTSNSEGIAEHPDHEDSVLVDLFEFHESR